MSTAGGGFLDNIVVKTTSETERCVDFLRKNRIGVGRFICLDKA